MEFFKVKEILFLTTRFVTLDSAKQDGWTHKRHKMLKYIEMNLLWTWLDLWSKI